MSDFNYMSFARLKSADKSFITEANKTAEGRANILGKLRHFVATLSDRRHVPDDELFALGCELRELWPAPRNAELIEAIGDVLSDVELRIIASGLQPDVPLFAKEALSQGKERKEARQRERVSGMQIRHGPALEYRIEPLTLTAEIVASYVGANNHVQAAEIPNIIRQVRAALSEDADDQTYAPVTRTGVTRAQVRGSITPDALISFIDNKPYKTLKRHLSRHGMSMEDYRRRYGLPSDYPSVAPNYSAARSEMAKKLGLGAQRRESRRAEGSVAVDGPRRRSMPKS